jgi:predicted DsbA family dithiol-disulfide isomerase
MEPIRILYFSDVLCVWAYIAQVRLDELKTTFGDKVSIEHHFVTVFGNTHKKLERGWRDRGGLAAYSHHVRESVKKFDHVTIHPDIWTQNIPGSSISAHVFLVAVHLLEQQRAIDPAARTFDRAIWAVREAFFTQAANISDRATQYAIAEELGLPISALQAQIDSGNAYARLSEDFDLVKEHNVNVSPTMIFNEGRQRLNGNVGYRVIEANIRELLNNPASEQSWC